MKRIVSACAVFICVAALWSPGACLSEEPVVIGVPTSLTALEGRESLKAVEMAAAEINATGGVKVGASKRPIKIETIDLRDSAPGVPVSEALLGMEKMITEKKVHAIVVGPFRSEALIPSMDLLAKYKTPMLATIAMSPKSEEKVKQDPEKYKYCFRVCLNAPQLVGYLVKALGFLDAEFGFKKLFAMNQDVLWAKMTAEFTSKAAVEKLGWESLGIESYPTGASDFSAGLSKVRTKNAQVILPVFDMPQSGILLKQWKSMKIPAMLCGFISPMAGPGAWKTFEGKIGGLISENCLRSKIS
jgi:branched-chain amino acid transport system substrate-binding protein